MPMRELTQATMRGPSAWSVGDRELTEAFVSEANTYPGGYPSGNIGGHVLAIRSPASLRQVGHPGIRVRILLSDTGLGPSAKNDDSHTVSIQPTPAREEREGAADKVPHPSASPMTRTSPRAPVRSGSNCGL